MGLYTHARACERKARYETERAAEDVVDEIRRQSSAGVGTAPKCDADRFKVYECSHCGGFHYGKAPSAKQSA